MPKARTLAKAAFNILNGSMTNEAADDKVISVTKESFSIDWRPLLGIIARHMHSAKRDKQEGSYAFLATHYMRKNEGDLRKRSGLLLSVICHQIRH